MNAFTVCVLAVIVAAATAQDTCHLCELMINDVKALHPEGFASVSLDTLTKEMNAECDKYLATVAFEDSVCKSMITSQAPALLVALQANKPTHQVCLEGKLCTA